MTIVITEYK